MSKNRLALLTTSAAPLAEAEYDAIFAAMMEKDRGRWFLTEYARRNRRAETELLLKAVARIEAALLRDHGPSHPDGWRVDLTDMARAIAGTLAEIAAIKPDAERNRKPEAAPPNSVITPAADMALSAAFAAAKRVRYTAWTMRLRGGEPELCEALDAAAREIDAACKLHEVAARRADIAIGNLTALKDRIEALLDSAADQQGPESAIRSSGEQAIAVPSAPEAGINVVDEVSAATVPVNDALAAVRALSEDEKIALSS